jgi:serine/threonine protein kinase
MTPEQWARVKELFNAALDQDPAARRRYVADASAGNDVLRAEVERLLDAHLESSGFIEPPAATTTLSGRVISHYEIGRLLGSGGMGHIYVARDVELDRDVAVKVASVNGGDAQSRLRKEAQHASRLSHPNICHVYEVGRADGQMFVVMELIQGRPLADLVREGPLPVDEVRRYGSEIADALSHAHEHGVTHRDLKSTNVMITPKRGAKVLDFGLARMLESHQIDALSHSQRSLTDEGMIAGTLPYMAPELLRGQRGDQRADIWALGVLLYEMAAGRRPFAGATGFELSAAILHQAPPPLPSTVPQSMRAVIQRCLEKNPGERFQQASDVHLALGQTASTRSFTWTWRMPSRAVKILALLVGIAVVGAGIVSYLNTTSVFSNVQGYSLLEEGAFDRAVAEFEGVTARAPNDPNAWDSLGEGYLANSMPEKALEAYSRALTFEPNFEPSTLGRGLALAALGRYDEALERESPDFQLQALFLSRVGRYREALEVLERGRRGGDSEVHANALLTAAWLFVEQKHYPRALEQVGAAEAALADRQNHSFHVLADLIAGVAEIRAGKIDSAVSRAAAQRSRHEPNDRLESNWVAALEGELALAQRRYDEAATRFSASRQKVWHPLGRDSSTLFAINLATRDGVARIEMARGNRPAAIEEYRRLTTTGDGVMEPRHILELARLLSAEGDRADARVEYERFLSLWTRADAGLPEVAEAKLALASAR